MLDELELAVIKDDAQYREYVAEVGRMVPLDPDSTSTEGKRLELLAFLVETYEKERFPIPSPNPIDAILFRLEQKGLQQKDLVPLIGSKSRVSEIISGRRRLTVPMVRRLSAHLDIPAAVLIGEPQQESRQQEKEPPLPLVREIVRRGWVGASKVTAKNAGEIVAQLFEKLGAQTVGPVFSKGGLHAAIAGSVDLSAMRLWITRVVIKSREQRDIRGRFRREVFGEQTLADLSRLSWLDRGPLLAIEYLAKLGIAVVVEEHLPGTRLDGAATLDTDGTPVIGLTLRHDRLDNFWFTLMHECAHVMLHLKTPGEAYVDDTEGSSNHDVKEIEANRLARDILIPQDAWRRSDANRLKTAEAIMALADQLKIHPAIVAGRIRRETGNYKLFPSLVGYRLVKKSLRK